MEGDVTTLSNNLVELKRDVGALSNTLASLNTELAATNIQQSEKANFAVTNINVSGALAVKGAPISYNDLKNLPVIVLPSYLLPISMTINPREVSGQVTGIGVYLYESSITPNNGMSRLTSFENVIHYKNLSQELDVAVSLALPAPAFIIKYALRAGLWSLSSSA